MKTRSFLLAFALASLFFSSCQSSKTENETKIAADNTNSVEKISLPANLERYEPEAAIINYTYATGPMNGKQILKFREHGKDEMRITEMNIMGKNIKSYALMKDGFIYSWTDGSNDGMKMKLNSELNLNFRSLPDSIKQKMNIKEQGNENVLGKDCKVYSLEMNNTAMKGTNAVWNGIPLKTEMGDGQMKMSLIADKIEENPTLTDSDFALPAGINFKEM